jgi:transposase InsO family protein
MLCAKGDALMPWKEICKMEERLDFAREVKAGTYSFAESCRRFGISRSVGYKWMARYEDEGLLGLADRSRAPLNCPHAVDEDTEEAIVALREDYPQWGPRKLRCKLKEKNPAHPWPAASTIGELLRRRGLSVSRSRRRKATPSSAPFEACTGANEVWCVDFKGWFRTQDDRRCDPLTLSHHVARPDGPHARAILEAAFREYGLPEAMRSDNGSPFASTGIAGLSRLSVWWMRLGIQLQRIRPGHPEENGRHERMHRTLKACTATPPAPNLRLQQRAFDTFRHEYNEERPHEALGQIPPGRLYTASTRGYPSRLPEVVYPSFMVVRGVQEHGQIRFNGARHFLGQALYGQRVGLARIDHRYWLVCFMDVALGALDLERYTLLTERQALHRVKGYAEAKTECTETAFSPHEEHKKDQETQSP